MPKQTSGPALNWDMTVCHDWHYGGNIRWTYVFYENGLSINVAYSLDEPKKRAVGYTLSKGMEVPPSSARSSSRDRSRSLPGQSAARTS